MTDIGTLPGGSWSTATGINGEGQVVGIGDTGSGEVHLFVWEDGRIIDLGPQTGVVWSSLYHTSHSGLRPIAARSRACRLWPMSNPSRSYRRTRVSSSSPG